MANCTAAVADTASYANLNYDDWHVEGYNIAIQLYDGKSKSIL